MSNSANPFSRGYFSFKVQREIVIVYDETLATIHRTLHNSQLHLKDDQIINQACVFDENVVAIDEHLIIPEAFKKRCPHVGLAQSVMYVIYGENEGHVMRLGDALSQEAAQDVIRQLSFQTGFYSRCWEISSLHISSDAMTYLADLIDVDTPTGMLYEVFRIPSNDAIGVKLFSTPWIDSNLHYVGESSVAALRDEHRGRRMPEELLRVLHLAGQADVRILIFDGDAPVLEGLGLFVESDRFVQ